MNPTHFYNESSDIFFEKKLHHIQYSTPITTYLISEVFNITYFQA